MSREVRHDGAGAFEVRFPFDRDLVELIKTLPNRRWNAAERFWSVPEQDVLALVELLHPQRFRFDALTLSVYQELGGRRVIEAAGVTVQVARLPGLFDEEEEEDESEDASAPASRPGDLTVSELNRQVKQVLESAFPAPLWLVGEISGFNRNAHKRIVSFQLAEHDAEGKAVSSVDATLFDDTRREIAFALAQAGDPFRLEDEVTVRVRARVELYVPWGSYRVVVEELDVHYTLGEAARRREEILRRLTAEGLVGLNSALELPALPLRVGLVTSLGSDACQDVLRSLQESGYAFSVVVHGARVQGRATEASVLNALDHFRERAAELDVVLICRGGGSRTDLAWFDTETLGRAVALFPLPVIVGIGHEQDHSVLDAVGRRAKTPTAAAALLVEIVRRSIESVELRCAQIVARAGRRVEEERERHDSRSRRLAVASRALLREELAALGHRRDRTGRAARGLVATARERLARWARDLPRAASVQLARQSGFLDHVRHSVVQAARRDLAAARGGLAAASRGLAPRLRRRFEQEQERAAARERRLNLVDPRRVVERGYAILRGGGHVLTDADAAPAGTALVAELRRGALRLRSEGEHVP